MDGLYTVKDGMRVPATVNKMFGTFGPYQLEGRRLDQLCKVSILIDSSTTTTREEGLSEQTSDTVSMIGRAIAGGMLVGGVGTILGALTGKKISKTGSIATEVKNVDLTVELRFETGPPLIAVLTNLKALRWLLELAAAPSMSDEEVEAQRRLADSERARIAHEAEERRRVAEEARAEEDRRRAGEAAERRRRAEASRSTPNPARSSVCWRARGADDVVAHG
jgi:hypothetical protein